MNPDSPGRVGARLIAGAAAGLLAAAAFAAPAAAQDEEPAYEPFLHGDVTITEAAPGTTVNVTPVFFQQQDLAADTAAVVVEFSDSVADRLGSPAAQAAETYDNCGDAAGGGIACVITGFTGQTGAPFTLTGPIGYAIDAKAPGPIDICGCAYTVTTVDEATLAAEYGSITDDPESANRLSLTSAADQAWTAPADTAAAAPSGAVTVVTTEQQFDLYVSGLESWSGSIGDQPSQVLSVNNAGPATAFDMSDEGPGSYVFRGRMPDGVELVEVNSDDSSRWTCLDESELAAEYERTEATALDRFDFVCYFESVLAGTKYAGLQMHTRITEGANEPGRFEVAPTYTTEYSENLDSTPWNDVWVVLNGRPGVPLARNDFNNDGLEDLVSVRRSDGALRLNTGNGDGTLDAATTMASSGWAGLDVVMAGEVNSDGHADLLVRDNATGTLYTYPGDGAGGLKPRIRSGSSWNTMGVFTTLDVDGDGMTDIMAVRKSDGGLYYYSGNGDGTFANGVLLATGYNYIDAMISVGDVDKDGVEDVMFRLSQTQEYWVFASTATEPVELSPTLGEPEGRRFRQLVGAGDLDRDGLLDLLSLDTRTSGLYRQSFGMTGWVNSYRTVQSSGWAGASLPMVTLDRAHDYDEDGASDILARRGADGHLLIYYGTGTGSFYSGLYTWGTAFSGMNLLETAGDLDGDNRPDLLARTSGGTLYVYPGNGTGSYVDQRIKVGGGWNSMSAIVSGYDYNGDGKTDIIAREASNGNLWLYPGTGTGSHAARVLIGTGWNSMSLITAVGDLNHDGTADVIAKKNSDNCMYFYAGKPAGGLKNGVKIGCGWDVMNAVAATGDFNGDGHPDWVARHTNGSLYLYKGNGAGTYSALVKVGSGWGGMNIIA
ncbi:MAG: VCBS repeat-containing protein [Glycomyces artemisiae]|uniref:VCBS repeat-containing protein n=1 Tax=Glycomyces artemisiae TaxID=1076443 RepID=A0A850C9M4_9ACTN|nr:VCBS repeat-containing protein [Glycomyces artemisiae]